MVKKSVIPFGPQHPVLPEPLQLRLELDDEKVVGAIPAIGYVHRGLERLAQEKDYLQSVFLMERVCGICSFMHAQNYCQGLEELLGVEVPPRARYLRVIWAELHRIHSHLLWVGLLADSFGFENAFMQAWRARETALDIMEATAGARILLGVCCIGGVRRDIDSDGLRRVLEAVKSLEEQFDEFTPAILNDYSVKQRTVDVGVLTRETAHQSGAVGPTARASGLARDLRVTGYAAYNQLGVTPVTETAGDCYARIQVRMRELYQSLDLIKTAVANIPASEIRVPVKGEPTGEVLARLEQPRGEVIYYIKGNGTKFLERMRVRTPTFANLPALLAMLPGCELADVPVITLSIDPCISCTER